MDTILVNGFVVDGSGAPGARADVGIVGGRIAAVGDLSEEVATSRFDMDGLVVTPGFIDIHTHFDAQVMWDPDLTPSSWHGVTSVVMGNCGFGIAPLRASTSELARDVLCTVEGMPPEAVDILGRQYDSFGAYLDDVRRCRPRLNMGSLVGHCALRVYAMGDEALERHATQPELMEMERLLRDALRHGALGLATSRSPGHLGPPGRAVPSRMAAIEEFLALAMVLADAGVGIVQLAPGPDFFLEEMGKLSARIGRPVTWASLLGSMTDFGAERCEPGEPLALLDEAAAYGGEVWPQISGRPVVTSFTMLEPHAMRRVPAFTELLAMPAGNRPSAYADGSPWRPRAVGELDEAWADRWDRVYVQESSQPRDAWSGRSIRALASEARQSPAATLIDLALRDDLTTRYEVQLYNDNVDEVADLLNDPRCILGLSDAGAHTEQLCDAVFPTHLLGTWVRERERLSLEKAVWRLTGQPADVFRLAGRGRIGEGLAADLVAFDPDTIGALPLERVRDVPGGAERLVGRSRGIEQIWVNGSLSWSEGAPVPGVRSGQLLEATA